MAPKSRLSKNLERRTKKRLYLSVIGIIVILFVLVRFGIPALINVSLFLANGKDQQLAQKTQNDQTIVYPPTLIQSFTATNSATISVSGTAAPKQEVELFVNDELSGTTNVKGDGSFTFNNITITSGGNTIKAKAKTNNKESNFSNILSITYANKAPSLTIDSPQDNQTFSGSSQQNVAVKGKTDNGDIKVTVNGFWAIVDDNGNYSYSLTLQNGDNHVKVIAQDAAGNQSEKDITVHFNQ